MRWLHLSDTTLTFCAPSRRHLKCRPRNHAVGLSSCVCEQVLADMEKGVVAGKERARRKLQAEKDVMALVQQQFREDIERVQEQKAAEITELKAEIARKNACLTDLARVLGRLVDKRELNNEQGA